ncbi:SDH family Clp fold serine proteinase [Methylobacterium sp. E-066]|uniref:SDH family Clp fold serine proteinase n=1 Tax=Methylobacterium sp. E-066 TaxID=2836584 RepID=UPI001FB8C2DD|nr:hypothetical protein [Methylobacterium sp. E-066]MCJ2140366.1 hypothetical protein [Methylobacterium sp. E-066]
MMSEEKNPLRAAIESVADHYDADVIAYVGVITSADDESFIRMCRDREQKRKNVLMILSTPGGSADAAYRVARCLQRCYNTKVEDPSKRGQFILYVHDFCKSAGTLLSLGSTLLIMSQSAQLGPIDVQLLKEEEVGERRSGLAPRQALETMAVQAGSSFHRLFRHLRSRSQLSTKMAAELAASLTVGVMEPIYGQLDPIRIGEVERFVRIAQEYGERLSTANVSRGTIERLLSSYPSHEFVIDRDEARELFNQVEIPTDELEFIAQVFIGTHHPTAEKMDSFVNYLNLEPEEIPVETSHAEQDNPAERADPEGEGSPDGQVRSGPSGDEGSEPHRKGRRRLMEERQAAE